MTVKNGIIISGLCKDYQLGRTVVRALRNIDLEIESGSFVCVAGPSGSGKTTLLNMIGLIDTPTSGTMRVAGEDIKGLPEKLRTRFRSRTLGFIFQSFNLLPVLDVYENVHLPLILHRELSARERRERVMEMVEGVGLGEHLRHRPYIERVQNILRRLMGACCKRAFRYPRYSPCGDGNHGSDSIRHTKPIPPPGTRPAAHALSPALPRLPGRIRAALRRLLRQVPPLRRRATSCAPRAPRNEPSSWGSTSARTCCCACPTDSSSGPSPRFCASFSVMTGSSSPSSAGCSSTSSHASSARRREGPTAPPWSSATRPSASSTCGIPPGTPSCWKAASTAMTASSSSRWGPPRALTEIWRTRVIALFLEKGLLNPDFARKLLSGEHSGFSIDSRTRIWDQDSRETLCQYIVRAPLSLQRIRWDEQQDTVTWTSSPSGYFRGRQRRFSSMDL